MSTTLAEKTRALQIGIKTATSPTEAKYYLARATEIIEAQANVLAAVKEIVGDAMPDKGNRILNMLKYHGL